MNYLFTEIYINEFINHNPNLIQQYKTLRSK